MNSLKEMKGTYCEKCKYFYDLDFSIDGHHNCCSIGICYLCNANICEHFEEGDVPDGKKRGEWER